jgi:hypothetical protein
VQRWLDPNIAIGRVVDRAEGHGRMGRLWVPWWMRSYPKCWEISMGAIGGLGIVNGLSGGSVFGDGESFVDWMARSFA